jgi:hypothetical protein
MQEADPLHTDLLARCPPPKFDQGIAQIIALVDPEKVAPGDPGRIGQALGAIQISDSARQRIEHVAFACDDADISDEASPEQARGAWAHRCAPASRNWARSSKTSRPRRGSSSGRSGDLLPDATRLLESIRQEQSIQSSHALIASLEGGIAESVALTSHLKAGQCRSRFHPRQQFIRHDRGP